MSRRRGSEHGFTLIELLVVVVILGILSAVVVFAVRGSGDKGEGAAVATDERIIRTALEAYCASKSHYPSPGDPGWPDAMNVLVEGKFLSSPSEYHGLATGEGLPQGSCPGTTSSSYEITCKDGSAMPSCGTPVGGGTTTTTRPPGFTGNPDAVCPIPEGWCPASPPAFSAFWGTTPNTLVQLGSGKVLAMTYYPSFPKYAHGFELFDPAAGPLGAWVSVPPPPGLEGPDVYIDSMFAIGGDNCGSRCGSALVHLESNYSNTGSWQLFDHVRENWSPSPPTNSAYAATYRSTRAAQIKGSGLACSPNCGKILVAYAHSESQTYPGVVELYDPKSNLFAPAGVFAPPIAGTGYGTPVMAALNDGRVLFTGYRFGLNGRVTTIFDPTAISGSPFQDAPASGLYHDSAANPAVVLPDGSVLQIGVGKDGDFYTDAAEIYAPDAQSPENGEWTSVSSCTQAAGGGCFILASLADGKILANAGDESASRTAGGLRSFLFDPASRTWTQTGSLISAGTPASGVLLEGTPEKCGLSCGKVLAAGYTPVDTTVVIGGPVGVTGRAELYSPPGQLVP